jgi:hypothetical protein
MWAANIKHPRRDPPPSKLRHLDFNDGEIMGRKSERSQADVPSRQE